MTARLQMKLQDRMLDMAPAELTKTESATQIAQVLGCLLPRFQGLGVGNNACGMSYIGYLRFVDTRDYRVWNGFGTC